MKDWMIHAVVAALMVSVYMMISPFALPVIAVAAHWYCWELAQRIAKDGDNKGFFYWWDMARWGDTAKTEALAPVISAVICWAILSLIGLI